MGVERYVPAGDAASSLFYAGGMNRGWCLHTNSVTETATRGAIF